MDADLRHELIEALLRVPAALTFEGRTTLLADVTFALNRDQGNPRTDFSLVVDGLDRARARDQLALVVDNAVAYVRGSELATQLTALRVRILAATSDAPPRVGAGRRVPTAGGAYDPAWHVGRREEEALALDRLRDGQPVVLLGPERCGRTWMLARLAARAAEEEGGVRAAPVSFTALGGDDRASFEAFLKALMRRVAREAGLGGDLVDAKWPDRGGVTSRAEFFLEDHVLGALDRPLLLALDAADAILREGYRDDFFSLLRSWSERRDDPWRRLRILVAISTRPAHLIDDFHRSLFNIAETIELGDLARDEVAELSAKYGLPWGPAELDALYAKVGGNPYLVRVAAYAAANGAKGVASGVVVDQAFQNHLRFYRSWLEKHPEHLALLRRVAAAQDGLAEFSEVARDVASVGFTAEGADGRYRLRCELYRRLIS